MIFKKVQDLFPVNRAESELHPYRYHFRVDLDNYPVVFGQIGRALQTDFV